MRKCTLPILPVLLAAVIAGVSLPAGPAHAQSKRSKDPKDREIELLKTEINQLEKRVGTLEGLDQRVKVIDQKVDVCRLKKSTLRRRRSASRRLRRRSSRRATDGSRSLAQPRLQFRFGRNHPGRRPLLHQRRGQGCRQHIFLNRVRPIFTGSVAKYYNFNITPDFGQGKVVLQDTYLNITYFDFASLRTGKFKAPLDLERLQSDRDLEFSERSRSRTWSRTATLVSPCTADFWKTASSMTPR